MTVTEITAQGSAEARAADLYRQYREPIFRLCMRQLGRREDAADALQTTFVYAFTSLRRGVVPQYELAWLWKIASNVCSTQRRSFATRAQHESGRDIETVDDALSAPDRAPHSIGADDLQTALRTLSPNQRQAILLREWKGLSYDEIGSELGLSHAATETLLYRARRTLAAKLDDLRGTYALDGLSFASLARSVFGSSAAKVTAAGLVTAASIAGTSMAVHEINRATAAHVRHIRAVHVVRHASASPVVTRHRATQSQDSKRMRVRQLPAKSPAPPATAPSPAPEISAPVTETPSAPLTPVPKPTAAQPPAATAPTPTLPTVDVPVAPPALPPIPPVIQDVIPATPPIPQPPHVVDAPGLPTP